MSDVQPAPSLAVWRFRLDLAETSLARLKVLLSPDELARASRFKFERDHRRYIAARGQLRQVLGLSTGTAAQAITFAYEAYGKPRLTDETSGLHFNLAHSDALALVVISRHGPVGVDLEYHRHHLDLDGIARRFFAPGEVARWSALPAAEQSAAFFRCWTRKEAYLKALGAGLSVALDQFEVSFASGEAPRLVWTADGAERRWSLVDIDVPAGFTAAAATPAGAAPPRVFDQGTWDVLGA